jgi:hypothetical protein
MPIHCFVRTAALAWALATATAHAAECDPRHASSPQFVEAGCRFQNAPNPHARPTRSGWDIWMRFIAAAKPEGTVPIDPIPVRMLDRATLDGLDSEANHVIR